MFNRPSDAERLLLEFANKLQFRVSGLIAETKTRAGNDALIHIASLVALNEINKLLVEVLDEERR